MSAVTLRGLHKDFTAVRVVCGVNLEIQEGEFVALLGPSGCGKTTTLRLVAGFESPTAGEIRIRERTVSGAGVLVPPEARNVGMVFQSHAVWPHMTVEQNVAYPLKLRGLSQADRMERARQMLELVQLPGLGGRYPHQLSGGQQQRVALGRALAMEPAVLLLDEPLSNLDAHLRKDMRLEIKSLQRRLGITVLYVTHDQEEALSLADRIAVMGHGLIHQIGSPEEVFEHPADPFVAKFMGCTTFLPCEVAGADRVRLLLGGEATLVSCPLAAGAAGRGILGLRAEDVHLGADGTGALKGRVTFRTYRGGVFEIGVSVGDHLVSLLTSVAVKEGQTVHLQLGRACFFSEAHCGAAETYPAARQTGTEGNMGPSWSGG
ncbi:MAG TPA: ABC transporter ATP-binding protein [Candidatus Methylomirabilis sp.]|nr:ABC transporter ATP-binding protein [Candidatus Methylomirabilis sp.]